MGSAAASAAVRRALAPNTGVNDSPQYVMGFACARWAARAQPTAPEAGALPKTTGLLAKRSPARENLRGFESNYGSMLSKDSHSTGSQPETGPVAESPAASTKIRSRLRWVVYAIAAIVVLVAAKYFHVQDLLKEALDWIGKLGPWGPVIFVGIYIVATVF